MVQAAKVLTELKTLDSTVPFTQKAGGGGGGGKSGGLHSSNLFLPHV